MIYATIPAIILASIVLAMVTGNVVVGALGCMVGYGLIQRCRAV